MKRTALGALVVLVGWGCSDASEETTGPGSGGGGTGGATTTVGSGGSSTTGAGGEAAGGNGGGAPQGMPAVVAVGNWGLRLATSDGVSWNTCRNPSTGNDHSPDLLRNVAYGNGVFIAVGGDANSMVMRSVDGIHWEEDLHPTNACPGEPYPASCTNWSGGVAYGDGVWIAGGGNGALMKSVDDGLTWVGIDPPQTPPAVRDVTFGNGVFVAGTDQGVAVSTDQGSTWTLHNLWPHSMNVTYGGGVFIAKGQWWNGSALEYHCELSQDLGSSWSQCDTVIVDSGEPVWDGSQWIAGVSGGYVSSPDAVAWTFHDVPNFPSQCIYTGELWIGRRGAGTVTSTDLVNWQPGPDVPGFRAWTTGIVLDSNLPVENIPACQDNG